jgi:hypothetical protein
MGTAATHVGSAVTGSVYGWGMPVASKGPRIAVLSRIDPFTHAALVRYAKRHQITISEAVAAILKENVHAK